MVLSSSTKSCTSTVIGKNWTHVRKVLGYLRYDTPDELMLINDLYHNELRLYQELLSTSDEAN